MWVAKACEGVCEASGLTVAVQPIHKLFRQVGVAGSDTEFDLAVIHTGDLFEGIQAGGLHDNLHAHFRDAQKALDEIDCNNLGDRNVHVLHASLEDATQAVFGLEFETKMIAFIVYHAMTLPEPAKEGLDSERD